MMQTKTNMYFTIIIMCCINMGTLLSQSVLILSRNSDNQISFTVNDIKKITFESGNFSITKRNNSSSTYLLSEIKTLKFGINTSVPTINKNSETLTVYPNPVSNIVNIKIDGEITPNGQIEILSLDGKQVSHIRSVSSSPISCNLGFLTKGVYIIRYFNKQTSYYSKITKL